MKKAISDQCCLSYVAKEVEKVTGSFWFCNALPVGSPENDNLLVQAGNRDEFVGPINF
jgi:hypothetical protein